MSAASSTSRDQYGGGIWPALNRLLIVCILLMMGTIAGYRFLPEVSKRRAAESRIEMLKTQIDAQRQMVTRRTREVALLQNDPGYIGMIARDRLDLMKAGEMIYRLDPPRPDATRMRLNP